MTNITGLLKPIAENQLTELTSETQELILRLKIDNWRIRHFEVRKGGPFDVAKSTFTAMCFKNGVGHTESGETLEEAYKKLWEQTNIRGIRTNSIIADDYSGGDVK